MIRNKTILIMVGFTVLISLLLASCDNEVTETADKTLLAGETKPSDSGEITPFESTIVGVKPLDTSMSEGILANLASEPELRLVRPLSEDDKKDIEKYHNYVMAITSSEISPWLTLESGDQWWVDIGPAVVVSKVPVTDLIHLKFTEEEIMAAVEEYNTWMEQKIPAGKMYAYELPNGNYDIVGMINSGEEELINTALELGVFKTKQIEEARAEARFITEYQASLQELTTRVPGVNINSFSLEDAISAGVSESALRALGIEQETIEQAKANLE